MQRRVENAFTTSSPPVEEPERRLSDRATESSGVIDERIALAGTARHRAVNLIPVENDDRERRRTSQRSSTPTPEHRYHGATVIHPRIDELLAQVDSRYALVIVAAKRARQINNYHHQLGESGFEDYAPPMVQSRSKNYLTMALEEVASGKLVYDYKKTT